MNNQEFNEWCVRMMERGLSPDLIGPEEDNKEFLKKLEEHQKWIHSLLQNHNYQSPLRPLLEKRTPCPEKDHRAVLEAPSIKTKAESIGLEMQGAFGNRLRSWNSLSELMNDPYDGLVAIRYKEPNSPYCQYNITKNEVQARVAFHVWGGADEKKFFFNEMGPHTTREQRIFQGEVMRTIEYLYLFYSLEDMPMRPALKEHGKHATGLLALSLLRTYMEPSSFEDLQVIFDTWPNAVVEFTTFSKSCGHVVGRESNFRRQTVFWEVREY